ncbi:MAG: DUF1015 domain-containing protein [Candidatus Abyssobacteria bacterium SURF_17]|uniref:DUF1015 domain-containing protein n=1 Tax=Candidatus Abyssobacteria bacterium SURF_17 TaxID=2093361 RepID=A0A419F0B5_9BACT|nr:MAG: DUF1015 domain-containing protein [Candidatus Abyssubacteria bacterium SURF_17]
MARIVPFRGLRYDPSRVDMREVVAPPYDVINDEERDFLHDRHPNNVVWLEKGKDLPGDGPGENKYARAGRLLKQWIASGMLRYDQKPSIYIYEQEYQYSSERPRLRRGFLALARLEDQESGVILGHEHTMMPPKVDRLNLMKECKANLSPIFSLYSQPDGSIDSILVEAAFTSPVYDFRDDKNIRNRFWVVNDPAVIRSITSQMENKSLIIADGHHRYETALIYRHIRRSEGKSSSEDAPYNYVMMLFVNLEGEGVSIYPIHRIIHGLERFEPGQFQRQIEKYFERTEYPFTCANCETVARNFSADMARVGETRHAFGLYLGGNALELLTSRDDIALREFVERDHCESFRTLDVAIAQAVILQKILGIDTQNLSKEEHVRFTPSSDSALEAVRRGEAQIALLLNPTKPEQVKAVTYEGEKMPQKSTYFYPKLLSGLVMNRFES